MHSIILTFLALIIFSAVMASAQPPDASQTPSDTSLTVQVDAQGRVVVPPDTDKAMQRYNTNEANITQVLYILFGWLLGLLSQPISLWIGSLYKRKQIKRAVMSELRGTAINLAMLCYRIQDHLGILEKPTVEWLRNLYLKYRDACPENILFALKKLSEMPDQEFNHFAELIKAPEGINLNIPSVSLPYLESVIDQLSVFNAGTQKKLMEIRNQVTMLDEEIANSRFLYKLTFDPNCMKVNSEIISNNLRNSQNEIQKRCRLIVEKIEDIMA
jgi:hypothetical protein